VAFAVPVDSAVVEGLSWLGGVAAKDGGDGGELGGIDTLGGLVDEPLDGFGAAAPGEGTLVGEVLTTEGLVELLKVDEAVGEALSSGRGTGSIDVLQEAVQETTISLLEEQDGRDDEVVVSSRAGLLVGDLDFTSVALAIDGVVSGHTESNGAHIVAGTITRVATAKSDKAKSTRERRSDLNAAALLLNRSVKSREVVTSELERESIPFTGTEASSVMEFDIDGALVLTRGAQVHGRGGIASNRGRSSWLRASQGKRDDQ